MERRLLSGILVIMFSAIMVLCGALLSQEAFADATPEQKTKLDKLVEKFNKDPIIRVPGLNKLTQDASEEELNKIYNAAIEEVKKKTRAEKLGIKVSCSQKGRFKAAYYDGSGYQAASIHKSIFKFEYEDGSYSKESENILIFNSKTNIYLVKNYRLSKVGTDKDKEVAVYKLKIDDDGFAADRYTTTVRLKLDGYTVWNGYIPSEYKENASDFANRISLLIKKTVLAKDFNIGIKGAELSFEAKEKGTKNLSVEFRNQHVELDDIKDAKLIEAEKKVKAAENAIGSLNLSEPGLNEIKEADMTQEKLQEYANKVLERAKKVSDAEKNGLEITLSSKRTPIFRQSTEEHAAVIRRIGIDIATKDGLAKGDVIQSISPGKSEITLDRVKEKSKLGTSKTQEVITYKANFKNLGSYNYTTDVRLYEGDNCLWAGHVGMEYKLDANGFIAKLKETLDSKFLTPYYTAKAEGDEITLTSVGNGTRKARLVFINRSEEEINTTVDAIIKARQTLYKYYSYENEEGKELAKKPYEEGLEKISKARTIKEVEKLFKETANAMDIAVNGTKGEIKKAKVKLAPDYNKASIDVIFGRVKNATNYEVKYRPVGTKTWKNEKIKKAGKYTIKKIKRNSLYEVKVVSINIYQDKSSESNSVFSYISKTKVKITKLRRALKVKVNRVKGASGYVVMVKNANNGKVYKIKTLKGEKKLNITIKNLKKNKRYFVLVRPFKVYKGHKYMGIATKTLRLKIK